MELEKIKNHYNVNFLRYEYDKEDLTSEEKKTIIYTVEQLDRLEIIEPVKEDYLIVKILEDSNRSSYVCLDCEEELIDFLDKEVERQEEMFFKISDEYSIFIQLQYDGWDYSIYKNGKGSDGGLLETEEDMNIKEALNFIIEMFDLEDVAYKYPIPVNPIDIEDF